MKNGADTSVSRRSVIALAGLTAMGMMLPAQGYASEYPVFSGEAFDHPNTELLDLSHLSRQEIELYSLELAKKESAELIAQLDENSGFLRARPRYENVYGPATYGMSDWEYIDGQPANGYSFSNGGSIIVSLSGGFSVTVGFAFPLSFGGSISISIPFARANAVSGVTINIPAGGRKKVQMNIEYVSTPYTTYYYDANGNKSVYAQLHSTPVISAYDYRVVNA